MAWLRQLRYYLVTISFFLRNVYVLHVLLKHKAIVGERTLMLIFFYEMLSNKPMKGAEIVMRHSKLFHKYV